MNFYFKFDKSNFSANYQGLDYVEHKDTLVYFYGLSHHEIKQVTSEFNANRLEDYLHNLNNNNFILFIYDKVSKYFFAVNDKFGDYEIFVYRDDSSIVVTDNLNYKKIKTIDYDSAYQFLALHTIAAPKTIYSNIDIVPSANLVRIDIKKQAYQFLRYWHLESLFFPKSDSYENHVEEVRKVFYESLAKEYTNDSAVTLSGGIDSGAILGMLTDYVGGPVPSISFGAQGINSQDLLSARKTVAYNSSPNTEVYPSSMMFDNLIELAPRLNQPVAGDFTFANSEMMRVAKTQNIKKLFYGFGIQMVLGNLTLNRLWHRERMLSSILPRRFLNFIYKEIVKHKSLSSNAESILTSEDWLHRFFYNQAALFTREKKIYTKIPDNFIDNTLSFLRPIIDNQSLKLSDRFVMLYLASWTNHGQQRHNMNLAKCYDITTFSPFDSPEVASVLFRTPDSFRKKSNWDKQVWRDAARPYVSEELYKRQGRSLLIPYTKIFDNQVEFFIDYLSKNKLVSSLVDIERYKSEFASLPETGLNLVRLISLAIWYDSKFDVKNLDLIKASFKRFDFDKKKVPYMAP